MGVYSAVLGFFIPSGGGKWIIEAPYVMQVANDLQLGLCFLSSLLVSSMIDQPLLITVIVMLATAPLAVLGYWLARPKADNSELANA